ncbi:MAG: V-type ATPase subunit [Candidatus Altiarchaeota archaeon]|nr:V-type ATPase subunit [Candidatus Altiarchaeota archaeon]
MMADVDVKDYAYPNARIRGMKSRLLDKKEFERGCGLDDLSAFVGFLEDNGYLELFDIKDYSQGVVEHVLFTHLVENRRVICDLSCDRCKDFMCERVRRPEILAIKGLINSKPENRAPFEIALTAELRNRFTQLRDAQDMERLISLFEDTRYGEALNSAMEDYRKDKLTFHLILSLDKYHFSRLLTTMNSFGNTDRRLAYEITGAEADAINIMTSLRTLGMKDAKNYLLPHHHHIGWELLDDCIKSRDVADVLDKLSGTVYADSLNMGLKEYNETNSLFAFEKSLKQHFIMLNRMMLTTKTFNISTLLSFLVLKENEIDNLRRIAVGLSNNLPEDKIKKLLIY